MATMRQAAQNVLDVGKDSIGWIVLWKDGRGWDSMAFWPDPIKDGRLVFEDYDRPDIQRILAKDPNAIAVNSYHHNLGPIEWMTRDSLASMLRWQYNLQHARLADYIQ